MTIDLKGLSRKELSKLAKDVAKALKAAEDRERRDARKAAEKAAAEFGYSLGELSGEPKAKAPKKRAKGKPKAKAKPKYRNPANPEQTWSGRGRKPQWIHDAVANNVDIADLEI